MGSVLYGDDPEEQQETAVQMLPHSTEVVLPPSQTSARLLGGSGKMFRLLPSKEKLERVFVRNFRVRESKHDISDTHKSDRRRRC